MVVQGELIAVWKEVVGRFYPDNDSKNVMKNIIQGSRLSCRDSNCIPSECGQSHYHWAYPRGARYYDNKKTPRNGSVSWAFIRTFFHLLQISLRSAVCMKCTSLSYGEFTYLPADVHGLFYFLHFCSSAHGISDELWDNFQWWFGRCERKSPWPTLEL